MIRKMIHVPLLSLALALSACIDEASEDVLTTEDESELSEGVRTWTNTATLRCLYNTNVGFTYTRGCSGRISELWTHIPREFGDQIRNYWTGFCLSASISGFVISTPCADDSSFQQWTLHEGTWGYEIKNVATRQCLDSDTTGYTYTLPCNGGNFQRWH